LRSTVGVVLHIFHEPVGQDILERLIQLNRPLKLFITSPSELSCKTREMASKVAKDFHFEKVNNRGRDIEPFLNMLHRLDCCDYVIKLHSKDSSTPLKRAWYFEMVEAIIGSSSVFDAIVDAFDRNQWVSMIGPKATWISAQKFMYKNREDVERLQQIVFGKADRLDWGFFAGSMFWYRRSLFSSLQHLWQEAISFKPESGAIDGAPEHAMERFFGYAPRDVHRLVGMVTNTIYGPVIEYDLPPSMTAISRSLSERHELAI
jgi:lipopolysaccharide biosynthesis protein